jgi:nucleoside 2-deoxyribosyltransferase
VAAEREFKIYCAGPLFNTKEKEEMAEIAAALETSGYRVFLPHRDGFEFAHLVDVLKGIGLSDARASKLLNKAIFTLDVFHVLDSDGLVLNINGRVPDEGATVEAGIAWNAGKQVVIYKNDARTLVNGNDNPLLLGLSSFVTIGAISEIPAAFDKLLDEDGAHDGTPIDNSRLRELYLRGQVVARLAENGYDKIELCHELVRVLGDE